MDLYQPTEVQVAASPWKSFSFNCFIVQYDALRWKKTSLALSFDRPDMEDRSPGLHVDEAMRQMKKKSVMILEETAHKIRPEIRPLCAGETVLANCFFTSYVQFNCLENFFFSG